MMNSILELDKSLFLTLNSLHFDIIDTIMLFLSYNKVFMLCILLASLFFTFKIYKKKVFGLFAVLLIVFGLSDSISTRVFKDNFKRLRPCHNQELKTKVHLAGQKCWGGKYGFVSSHAANSFAIATFFWLLLKAHYSLSWILFLHAFIVSYSRIYLAKHYPLDIICGALLGVLIAFTALKLVKALPRLQGLLQRDQL